MGDRAAGIYDQLKAATEKHVAAKTKRDAKRAERPSHRQLHVEWVKTMRELYGHNLFVAPWGVVEVKLAKALIKEVGFGRAVEVVKHFVGTWNGRQRPGDVAKGAMPSLRLCWSIREKLVAEIDGVVATPRSKADRLQDGEWDEQAARLSPSEGWGTL